MTTGVVAVVLAGGASKRMQSKRSKVLHPLAGRPLLHYPVLAATGAGATRCIVVASPANRADVEHCLSLLDGIHWEIAIQERPLGTGDAARAALPQVSEDQMLLLCGDTPLVQSNTLKALLEAHAAGSYSLSLLSCHLAEPQGYGRVLRDARGNICGIREQRDLKGDEQDIHEVNAGMYCGSTEFFKQGLSSLTNDNAQGEYYVTDIVETAAREGSVGSVDAEPEVLQGINDRVQLARLEQVLFERIADRHRRAGVTISPDARIDDTVQIATDVSIGGSVSLRGRSRVGEDSVIDQGCVVTDSEIGVGVVLRPYTVVSESRVGDFAEVGPFAQLRPGSELGPKAKVGNFVETKKARLNEGAKANHLAYLGDVDVGAGSNIGAGTIVCNYDGFSKWPTRIGKGVFIGSDSQLVAPVTVGDGAFVATNTTVVEDVPAEGLALSRPRQVNKPDYAPKLRAKLQARADEKKASENK